MQLVESLLVVPDSLNGGLLPVRSVTWRWQAFTDVTAPVRVVHQDGSPYSLGGAVAALLAFYVKDTDAAPILQLEWIITGDNTAIFSIPRDTQTLYLPPCDQGYMVGVRFRDDDVGMEDVVSLAGRVMIDARVGDFSSSVIVPSSQEPLARGPSGAMSGATLPTPSSSYQGQFFTVAGASGVADIAYICLKATDDTYSWKQVASG